MTNKDTKMDLMIADMDLLQFLSPSSSHIKVLMVEPEEFGQELDQSDADGGAKKHCKFSSLWWP